MKLQNIQIKDRCNFPQRFDRDGKLKRRFSQGYFEAESNVAES